MPKLGLVPGGASATPGGEFDVAFADEDGERRLPLTEVWSVPFESCLPLRGFPFYKGQRHHAGRWWVGDRGPMTTSGVR